MMIFKVSAFNWGSASDCRSHSLCQRVPPVLQVPGLASPSTPIWQRPTTTERNQQETTLSTTRREEVTEIAELTTESTEAYPRLNCGGRGFYQVGRDHFDLCRSVSPATRSPSTGRCLWARRRTSVRWVGLQRGK